MPYEEEKKILTQKIWEANPSFTWEESERDADKILGRSKRGY